MIPTATLLWISDTFGDIAPRMKGFQDCLGTAIDYDHVTTLHEVEPMLMSRAWSIVLCDADTPWLEPMAIMGLVRRVCPETAVIFFADHPTLEVAVDGMRLGARGYVDTHQPEHWENLVVQELKSLTRVQDAQAFPTDTTKQRYAQRLELMHQIDVAIWHATSLESIAQFTLPRLRELIGCERATMIVFDWATNESLILEDSVERPYSIEKMTRFPMPTGWDDGFGDAPSRILNDLRTAEPAMPIYERLIQNGLLSGIQALLKFEDKPIGMVGLNASQAGYFTPEHLEITTEIARQITIAFQQLHLADQTQRHTIDIERRNRELHEAQEALRRSEARFRSVVDDQTDLICRYDAEFVITFANRAYGETLGIQVGQRFIDSVPLEDREKAIQNVRQLSVSEPVRVTEHPTLTAEQSIRWFQWTDRALFNDNGEIIEYQGVGRDITERKQYEEALKQAHANLEDRVVARTQELNRVKSRVEAILNNSTDGIVLAKTDLSIQQTNQSFNSLFACRDDQYFGLTVLMLVQDSDVSLVTEAIQWVIFEQKGRSVELRVRRYDGMTFEAELSIAYIKNDTYKDSYLVLTIRDITRRKKIYAELSRSNADLQAVINSTETAFVLLDSQGKILVVNTIAQTIFKAQFGIELTHGNYMVSYIPPAGHIIFHNRFQHVMGGGTVEFEQMVPSGAKNRYFDFKYYPVRESNGQVVGINIVFADITEQKDIERQLLYHASVQDNLLDAVISTDLERRIQTWNVAAEKIYGWHAEEVLGKTIQDILQPQYASDEDQQAYRDQLDRDGFWVGEKIHLRKDGLPIDILATTSILKDKSGIPYGLVSVNHDITEYKRTQRVIAEERNLLRTLIDAVPDYIYVKDTQHRILFDNIAHLRSLGLDDPQAVLGKTDFDLFAPELAQQYFADEKRVLGHGQSVFNREEPSIGQDQQAIWAVTTKVPLKDLNGNITGLVGITHDITAIKQQETALLAKIEQEREFQHYLTQLHEITLELMEIETVDDLYRLVVHMGRARLDFDRVALFFYDTENNRVKGSFGTDASGQVVNEGHLDFPLDPNGTMVKALQHDERFYYIESMPLLYDMKVVGMGWHATVALWSGNRCIGWLVADNLLRGKPASKALLDTFGLYGLTISTLLVRKQTEADLRESEARYRLLADNISDVVMRLTPDGTYIYISPSSRDVLGYEPSEMVGHHRSEFIDPDNVAIIEQKMSSALQSPAAYSGLLFRFRHKDGHTIWLESTGRSIWSETTGKIVEFVILSRDVTARKRIEDALAESEKRFRLFVEVAPLAIVVTNDRGIITLVNEQVCGLFGYERDELVGQTIEQLIPNYARETAEDKTAYTTFPQIRQMGEELGLFGQRQDGSQFPIEIELSFIETHEGVLVMSFVMDITERRQREQELRYHASLQENVTDAVISTDLNFVVKSWNGAAERLYGWRASEVIGKSISFLKSQYMPGVTAKSVAAEFLEKGFWTGDVTQAHKDGTRLSILSSVVLFKDERGHPFGVVAVNHDISAQKRVEESLRQALAKEQELGELKSRFVSMASHEFRTPLATIQAMTDTLSTYRHKMSSEQIDQKFDKIKQQVSYLKDIMEDVLKLARMQARQADFNPQPLDIRTICQNVIEEFQGHPDIGHHLNYASDEDIPAILLDQKLIRQIMSNLISNAIKYSPSDKDVDIRVRRSDAVVMISVRDHGIGIPEDDLKYIFEPFHRASNVGTISGTGLGLVITKESIERHGGTIGVESQVGVGTTFIVTIPLSIEHEVSYD